MVLKEIRHNHGAECLMFSLNIKAMCYPPCRRQTTVHVLGSKSGPCVRVCPCPHSHLVWEIGNERVVVEVSLVPLFSGGGRDNWATVERLCVG